MPFDSVPTDKPDVIVTSGGPNGSALIFRSGGEFARNVCGPAWKARADAENAARMEKAARIAAQGSLADQVAALAAVLPKRMGGLV